MDETIKLLPYTPETELPIGKQLLLKLNDNSYNLVVLYDGLYYKTPKITLRQDVIITHYAILD